MKAKKDKDSESARTSDETIRLSESKILPPESSAQWQKSQASAINDKNARVTVGAKYGVHAPAVGTSTSADTVLIQSENLRIAQQKIFELEEEIERLRIENEKLAAAGETLRRSAEKLTSENEQKTKRLGDTEERLQGEREILESSLMARDRELTDMKLKIEEYEMRLTSNLQKIRVRERELENRLELVKMESAAVVRSKDELILELKRQLDQLTSEIENYRAKSHELNKQLNDKQDLERRTVKALRLALSLLENGVVSSHSGQVVGQITDELEQLKKAK